VGYFPTDYVEKVAAPVTTMPTVTIPAINTPAMQAQPNPQPSPSQRTSVSAVKARVKFDFAGTGSNEMPLKTGEIIDVVFRGAAGGWSKGVRGAFPTDYVDFNVQPNPTTGSFQPLTTIGTATSAFPTNVAATAIPLASSQMGTAAVNAARPALSGATASKPLSQASAAKAIDLLDINLPSPSNTSQTAAFAKPPTAASQPFGGSNPLPFKVEASKAAQVVDILGLDTISAAATVGSSLSTMSRPDKAPSTKSLISPTTQSSSDNRSFPWGDTNVTSSAADPFKPVFSADPLKPSGSKADLISSFDFAPSTSTFDSASAISNAFDKPLNATATKSLIDTSFDAVSSGNVPIAMSGNSIQSSNPWDMSDKISSSSAKPAKDFMSTSFVDQTVHPLSDKGTGAKPASSNISKSGTGGQPPQPAAPPPTPAAPPAAGYARVLYSRVASSPTELTINVNDILVVLKKDSEWWYGAVQDGNGSGKNLGFFPGNYVVEISEAEARALIPPPSLTAASSVSTLSVSTSTVSANIPLSTSSDNVSNLMVASTTRVANNSGTVQRRLPTKIIQSSIQSGGMVALDYALETINRDKNEPVWMQPFYLDFFADEYRKTIDDIKIQSGIPAIERFRHAFHVIRTALAKVPVEDETLDGMKEILVHVLGIFREANIMCDSFPVHSNDPQRFQAFLSSFMQRLKNLHERETLLVPTTWYDVDSLEYGVLLVVTKQRDESDSNYSIAIINTGGDQCGLNFHPFRADPEDGSILRNLAFEFIDIQNARVFNTAFWFLLFRSSIMTSTVKPGARFYYDKIFPFLTGMPLLCAHQNGILANNIVNDYSRVPLGGDTSFILCALECLRYLGRQTGLTQHQSTHLIMQVKYSMLDFVRNDVSVGKDVSKYEFELIRLAIRSTANSVGNQVGSDSTVSTIQMSKVLNLISATEENLAARDDTYKTAPIFNLNTEQRMIDICEWMNFGRFRREYDVEPLAGDAAIPPILRPVEMTLVPEKVDNFHEAAIAMRHTLNLCVLLSNQRALIRNSYTLRVCLIQHLFLRIIPLPLPINHPDRLTKCFWQGQDMRYETQADIMRLLNMLCRHFATASLSVKVTRSGDAIRMLVLSCMATVCDVVMRKIASDIPAQSSLHYSGCAKGPIQPFGFDMANFGEESEYLKFSLPEAAAARSQVLDYFHQMKKIVPADHILFNFDKTTDVTIPDRRFMDQLCLQMGFPRSLEPQYITGANQIIIEHYPEIQFFRDIVFMFKLVMVPTSDKLPELKAWTPNDAMLDWTCDDKSFTVQGFSKKLDCVQNVVATVEEQQVKEVTNKRSWFSRLWKLVGLPTKTLRSIPSQANPSILLGERVDSEDDILHIRNLPDFDGTLGAKDCELMLQYLTAPYMRIPLLLHFFSYELRLKALRCRELQEVLDAAIFEPGQWQEEPVKFCPTVVPAPDRNHLCTPVGLLFNEIILSPNIILSSIQVMLERVIDMDTGKYSELSESILYVVRLAVRVEAYLLYLVHNFKFHQQQKKEGKTRLNGAYQEATVRGLDNIDEKKIEEAQACQKHIRQLLDDKVFRIIARWTTKAKNDKQMHQACILHAHLAYLHRNIDREQLNPRVVFSMLASQIYLFNNYKYDLDIDLTKELKKTRADVEDYKTDLVIPQVELFDLFQRNRKMILEWLETHVEERNIVMDGIVQLIEEGGKDKNRETNEEQRIIRTWVALEHSGLNFRGRFVPENEFDKQKFEDSLSPATKKSFESWLRETTTLAVNTEINVQLGEFTVKKHATRPLEPEIRENPDFEEVLPELAKQDIIQCAEVKNTTNRKWVRLVGMGYDLQLWNTDTRKPSHDYTKHYQTVTNKWVKEILDPWLSKVLPGIDLFYSGDDLTNAEYCVLYGNTPPNPSEPEKPSTLKEVIIYRYPRVFHIYNIVEHGRRFYRYHIFSSSPVINLSDMKTEALHINGKLFTCSGNPTEPFQGGSSLIISRYLSEETTFAQTFLPRRYLRGVLPSALVIQHVFWQNDDDSITGYVLDNENNTSGRSILKIDLEKTSGSDLSGNGLSNANAIVTKIYVVEEEMTNGTKDWTTMIPTPDPNRQPLYLVNLMAVCNNYYRDFMHDNALVFRLPPTKECSDMVLLPEEDKSLHALVRQLLRLDTLAHIVAWSKINPRQAQANGQCPIAIATTIDMIEFPRLRLSFEKRTLPDGTIRYYCIEQPGMFIAGYRDELKFGDLLDGLANTVLLTNVDQEYFALIPAIAKPALVKGRVHRQSYTLVYNRSDNEWIKKTGEATSFICPIHTSGCFFSSRSVASSLYLLALRLMTRRYKEAFRLIESCSCDTVFTPQEQQIYDVISNIKDDFLADAHACRLKLFFISYGCSDVMPFKYNMENEMLAYVECYNLVSSHCRLNPEEEVFIMSLIPSSSPVRQNIQFVNRERILKASFDFYFDKFTPKSTTRTFIPMYPPLPEVTPFNKEVIDLDVLDPNKPNFKSIIQKLSIVKYNRPDPVPVGPDAIAYICKILDEEKQMGFFFLYELMTNSLNITIIPEDHPHTIGALLFRFLPESFVGGLQNVILRIMETHPELMSKMPIFEDKRKIKLPTFAGLDIYQTHIRAAAAYLKSVQSEIAVTRLIYDIPLPQRPSNAIQASPTVDMSPERMSGRMWIVPKVSDYNSASKLVSAKQIPGHFKILAKYYTNEEIFNLASVPLEILKLSTYTEPRTLKERGLDAVSIQSPLRVMSHPSSRSHIARTSVQRLEGDINDFATDENASMLFVYKSINSRKSSFDKSHVKEALAETNRLINDLIQLRDRDTKIVTEGVTELLSYTNGYDHFKQGSEPAGAHILLQKGGFEANIEFDFLASCTATSESSGDPSLYSYFLSSLERDSILSCTMLLMMTTNRVNHASLAVQQARNVVKLLNELNRTTDSDKVEQIRKELLSLSDTLAATLTYRRFYSLDKGSGLYELDPRFLLFEFCHSILLRESQVTLVRQLLSDMNNNTSVCHQMIMGAGKTTVVGPLLSMLLASKTTLVFEVVPPALLYFSASVLRERFSAAIRKPVFTFSFDRYSSVTPELLFKLRTARNLRAVIVASPTSIKSFMLKFIEQCHNLNRQKNIVQEKREASAIRRFDIRYLLGLGAARTATSGELKPEEIKAARNQADICEQIFQIFRNSVEIMDEVDIILHPLKSELNWPLGLKEPLDFTRSKLGNGLRWSLPSHLLDAIFSCCGMPILADIADSRKAKEILDQLEVVINRGFETCMLLKSPHLAIVSKNFYDVDMKPVLIRWLVIWLRARKLPTLTDDEIIEFLNVGNRCSPAIMQKIKNVLGDDHVKMLNLGHDWIESFLPFVLQKINRVHFGLLQPNDIEQLEAEGVKIPTSRKLTAVPFVAKDVPSRSSEFAHPDVLVGLTILAFRYEGLRKNDFSLVLRHLRDAMEEEGGLYKDRPSCQKFEQWILATGKAIRGSKKREKGTRRSTMMNTPHAPQGHPHFPSPDAPPLPPKTPKDKSKRETTKEAINIFADIFSAEDDLIWPLQLVDLKDREQFRVLYPLLYKLPHSVMHYLHELVFPEVLKHQGLKLSTCGQELGGDMLFGKRIGFSGTPSDILPVELGSCRYERGSDGRVVHYLTSTSIVQHVLIPTGWNVYSLLDYIATAKPVFHALIDTGALITGLSNKAVAEYLLKVGLGSLKGVVYLDEMDRQMVLLRKGFKVVKLADSGLAWNERFSFYDQVHTTGMDIKQAVDACAAVTLGKDMVFRDYAQGAFRMRGIGKGQTIKLLVVPEIYDRIRTQVAIGSGQPMEMDYSSRPQQFLKDVLSWLVINSMRVDGIQYNLLCEQNVMNIWRKRCFAVLRSDYRTVDLEKVPPEVIRSLQVFRERVDFEIENSVPTTIRYSEKILNIINTHR
jgi:hypothetical protein